MALTKELLKSNAPLASLTDDQLSAIITLSENDLSAEISKKFGEVYRQLDQSIKTATGVDREGDEKTYKYLERAVSKMKTELGDTSSLQTQIDNLTAEKARLEQEVAKGGSEETIRLLNSTKAELANTKTEYSKLQTKLQEQEKRHKSELLQAKVSGEIGLAASGLTFKKEIPQSALDVLVSQAKSKLLGMSPDYIDDGKGGKRLVFRGEDGAIKNNPNNQLNPYTAGELLTDLLADVLAPARSVEGAGSNQPPVGGGGASMDLSSAKTRTEASEIITKQLLAQGLTVGSQEFQEQMDKAWKDNNISSLPFK